MKKAMIALALAGLAISAQASIDDLKIATVKKIYQPLFSDKWPNYYKLATADFKKVIDWDDRVAKKIGESCIDFDPIISAQDYDKQEIKRTIEYRTLPNGNVQVSFRNFNELNKVEYALSCTSNKCLIDDIGGFKQGIKSCLKLYYSKYK
ncbi:hypothetical protein [Lonepinella sp. BR2271]|uniref:hypothetical protein n=1 Tax=Lonepinella sp. BR2271 TaxID=3434550 RepID=UPI003F6E3FD7